MNTIDGGSGWNAVDYGWTTLGVRVDLDAPSSQATSLGGGAEGFTDQIVGVQRVYGGSGADTFAVRTAPPAPGLTDLYDGRGGNDTFDFSSFASAVWIDLGGFSAWTRDSADLVSGVYRIFANFSSIENVIGSTGSDFINGSSSDNTFGYVGGHDVIDGQGNGASGDTVDFSTFGSAVWVYLGAGAGDEAWTRDGSNVLTGAWRGIADIANVERVIGTSFDDQLYATSGTRSLSGGGGADTLFVQAVSVGATVGLDGAAGASDTADFSQFGVAVWIRLSFSGFEGWTRDGADVASGAWRAITDIAGVENVVGSAFSDDIQGDGAANRIVYNGGVDKIDGAGGTDTLDASRFGSAVWIDLSATDRNFYTQDRPDLTSGVWREIGSVSNIENVVGTAGADDLRGNAGGNVMEGGAGNDVLLGRGGADTLDGGDGNDTASYAGSAQSVTVNLFNHMASGGDAQGDTLDNIENLIGSAQADSLTGTNLANVLDGGGGADLLIGMNGDDTYLIDNANDAITENVGEGIDLLRSSLSATNLGAYANVENYQHIGATTFTATATGNALDNVFFFTALAAGQALATIDGGANTGVGDTVDFSGFSAAVWVRLGNAGVDAWTTDTSDRSGTYRTIGEFVGIENLVGSRFDDFLAGDGFNNHFGYTGGFDIVDGGGGTDTLLFTTFASAIWVDLNSATDTVWTRDNAGLDTGTWRSLGNVSNVENILGGAGADFFRSALGVNAIDGAGGIDTVSYSNSLVGVQIDLLGNVGTGGTAAGDTLNNIENLIGSASADTLTGDGLNNTLDGGGGVDTLIGGAGDDIYILDAAGETVTEISGEGTDLVRSSVTAAQTLAANVENYGRIGTAGYTITGNGEANDFVFGALAAGQTMSIDGATGNDTVDFSGFGSSVWINLAPAGGTTEAWTTDAPTQTGTYRPLGDLANIENLVGSAFDDVLTGDGNANRFVYTGGNDVVNGAGGTDTLDYSRFASAVWVDLTLASGTAYTRDGADLAGGTWRAIGDVSNIENVVGTIGADLLRGDNNANVILGGAGNDTIIGRGGSDTLTGGLGADTFVYQGAGGIIATGLDVITDFVRAADLIRIESGLTQLAAQAALHIDNTGADALVTFDNSPAFQITILNVDLDQTDFVFA